ncbi:hypothetical protein POM88_007719 [Heracleum sosnowskyi]|uniref:DUF3615 domain-containing protein n=1 Tax=Heracleum sosnowskyi TaxID=360622 RepID=A0AAD8J831_9APIA|nr:hypothetical protein POM88_007719 [Heracleum sosnowskyi]
MVILRSGRELDGGSSSIATKSHLSDAVSRHREAFRHLDFQPIRRTENPGVDKPMLKFATQALNVYNQNSPQKFQLLKLCGVTPVYMKRCMLLHISFTAENTHVAAAPKEMFFTEMANFFTTGLSVRLCVSLGPINSLSATGDKLNGCYNCRSYNNVWHPKGGGFIRGYDGMYKTVQDICDINQNNAIPEYEMHLAMLKQVSRSHQPKKDIEYIAEQVDVASLYASETLKFYNQGRDIKYELVTPGFVTCVILPTCLLFHVNFKAKETDVVTAPEKMFFAELTGTSGVFSCKCCTILRPSDLISGEKTGDMTNGCYHCHKFNNVHHPIRGGFFRGGPVEPFICFRCGWLFVYPMYGLNLLSLIGAPINWHYTETLVEKRNVLSCLVCGQTRP